MSAINYLTLVEHYEACLEKYGDTHQGVDWPNQNDANTRYQIMLEVIRTNDSNPVTLLDFGCGTSQLYEYMVKKHLGHITYSGLDLSEKFIQVSKSKFPNNAYYSLDILKTEMSIPKFDYVVMNGVFTEKRELLFEDMLSYFQDVICKVFEMTNIGIAFNVMSKHVDWERNDLFHLPFDTLAGFLTKTVSRNFVLRNDYGLYEYTAYVYKRN